MQNNNKRRAFTMIELVTACLILTGVTAVLVNTNMAKQTAQREAEKVLEWINKLTQTSNKIHQPFYFKVGSTNDNIIIQWPNKKSKELNDNNYDDKLQAASGCKYESNKNFSYTLSNTYSPAGNITITGTDDSKYYIIFSTRGRARISPVLSDNDDNE